MEKRHPQRRRAVPPAAEERIHHAIVEDRALQIADRLDVGMAHRQEQLREPGAAEAECPERPLVDVLALAQLRNRELHVAIVDLERPSRVRWVRHVLAIDHRDDEAVAGEVLIGDGGRERTKGADEQRKAPGCRRRIRSGQEPRAFQPRPALVGDLSELREELPDVGFLGRPVGRPALHVRHHRVGKRDRGDGRSRSGRIPDVDLHATRTCGRSGVRARRLRPQCPRGIGQLDPREAHRMRARLERAVELAIASHPPHSPALPAAQQASPE